MRITAIGELLADMTQTGRTPAGVPLFAANPGGAPANLAVAAARLGADTAFIGCVGADAFGDLLRETLRENGVDITGLQVTRRASTTLAVVTVDESGERGFSFCRAPGADTCIDGTLAMEAARRTDSLHFGSVSLTDPDCRTVVMGAVRAAKAAGAIVTYDPNYRAALWNSEAEAVARMREPLSLCDIVKLSDEETALLTGAADPRTAAQRLLEQGVRLAVITLGGRGAYWRMGDREGTEPGIPVTVADTNGAGDTFFGALLCRIARRGGLDGLTPAELEDYIRYANRAAAITVSRPGAIPAMPTRAELEVL